MYCPSCGKEIGTDSQFCPFCGEQVAAAGAPETAGAEGAAQGPVVPPAAPPPPPPVQGTPTPPSGQPPAWGPAPSAPTAAFPPGAVPPSPEAGPLTPPANYAQPRQRSALPWVLGILGVAVVAAVVLVLVFVVFKGDGGKTDTAAIERPVVDFFESLEDRDVKQMVGAMEPDFVDQLKDILGKDYLDLLEEYFFLEFPDGLEFTIRKLHTEMKGEDKAEVTVVEGTMSYIDEDGEKVSEEASESDMDAFEVVKVDGVWYISEETLVDMGFDLSDLEDTDMEDLDTDLDTDLDSDMTDYGDELVELPVDTEDEALTLVFEQPEVMDWWMATAEPLYRITDENTSWAVLFYEEAIDGTEIPFAWYAVDKETGEVWLITND
ncbi:MAG: zinc-ribbon domain-containing protein [Actinobacteria bacterium]|nr:zinc-ribbon domain-containing protein [Actinomycetota bacterium]